MTDNLQAPEPPDEKGTPFYKVGGPVICDQPSIDFDPCPCQTFELSVSGGDCCNTELTYQWYLGLKGDTTSPLEDETQATLRTQVTENTTFWVRVKNCRGSCFDSNHVDVVIQPLAIEITQQPTFLGDQSCTNVNGFIEVKAETCIEDGGLTDPPSNEVVVLSTAQPAYDDAIIPEGFDVEIVWGDQFVIIPNAIRQTMNAADLLAVILAAILELDGNIQVGYTSGAPASDPIHPFADIPAADSFRIEFINEFGLFNVLDVGVNTITTGSHDGLTAGSGDNVFCVGKPIVASITQGSSVAQEDLDPLNDPDFVCYQWYEGVAGDTSKPISNPLGNSNILQINIGESATFWVRLRSKKCMDVGFPEDEIVDSADVTVSPLDSIELVSGIEPDWIQPDVANRFEVVVTGFLPQFQWYKGFRLGEGDETIIGQTYRVMQDGGGDLDYSAFGGEVGSSLGDEFVATAVAALAAGQSLGDITTPLVNEPGGDSSNRVVSGAQGPVLQISPNQLESTGIADTIALNNPIFHPSGDTVPDFGLFEPLVNSSFTSIGGIVVTDAGVWEVGNTGSPDNAASFDVLTTGNPQEHDFEPLALGMELLKVSDSSTIGEGDVPEKDTQYRVTFLGAGQNYYFLLAGTRFFSSGGQLDVGSFGNRVGIAITTTGIWMECFNNCNTIELGVDRVLSMPPAFEEMFGEFAIQPDNNPHIREALAEIAIVTNAGVNMREGFAEFAFTPEDSIIPEAYAEFAFFEPPPP